jgi:hypothetical protein
MHNFYLIKLDKLFWGDSNSEV